MGQLCAGNIFQQLQDKYGNDFVKLMVAEQSKDLIKDNFGKINTDANGMFNNVNGTFTNTIDTKMNQLTSTYQGLKSKAAAIPGAISSIQAANGGRPIDEISGFNNIKNQIVSIKTNTLGKVQDQKNSLFGQMNKKQDQMLSQVQKQRPKIELYDNLPEPLQRTVREQATTVFADQLDKNKGAIASSITSQFSVDKIQQTLLANVNPENQLKQLVGGASGKFTQALGLNKILGGSFSLF